MSTPAKSSTQCRPDARLARLRSCLAHFGRGQDGSATYFALMLFFVMLAVSGLALDFMYQETTRTRLQNTLDRSVLAATELGQTLDSKAVVKDYFEKAGLGDYIDEADIDVVESKAFGSVSYRRVSATADAELDTFLLRIVGIDTVSAVAASTAEEGVTDLEISLVLDVSGSMGSTSSTGRTKIYELREAAKDFVYYMQCNPAAERDSGTGCSVDPGKVSVSVVPYAEQVNVGPTLLSQFNVTDEHMSSHCVTFEDGDYLSTSLSTVDLLNRTSHFDPWSSSSSWAGNWTCKTDSWRRIQPFLGTHTKVYDVINSLSAGGNTSIDVGMKWGTALLDPAARDVVTNLVSTSTGSGTETVIDPVFLGRPYDYTQDYAMKVIVLMTDGQNTNEHYINTQYRNGPSPIWHYRKADGTLGNHVYSVYHSGYEQYRYVDEDGNYIDSMWHDTPYVGVVETNCRYEYTYQNWWKWKREWVCDYASGDGEAYQLTYPQVWAKFTTAWFKRFDWLGDPDSAYDNPAKNARLDDICSAAKTAGILIYSIGFEVDEGSNAEQVMKSCASTTNHYFPANGTNLADVFGVIATSINQLRLIQ